MKHIQFILLFFFIFSSCDSSDPEQTNTSDKDVVSRPTPEKRVGINDLSYYSMGEIVTEAILGVKIC